MFKTEIDTHSEINAPESSSWNIFKREQWDRRTEREAVSREPSKWLWVLPALSISAAILLVTFCVPEEMPVNASSRSDLPAHQVVIEHKRMTAQEKLDYDLAPERIARVEITAHRGKSVSESEKSIIN